MTTRTNQVGNHRAGLAVGAALLCAVSLTKPAAAKHHTSSVTDVQKAAMKALKKQQHQQWINLHRQESQENKIITDKDTLRRLKKEQRDALKRQQKLQKDMLKHR